MAGWIPSVSRTVRISTALVVLGITLVVVWFAWAQPSRTERDAAFATACADALRLHNVGLLDEARTAYTKIGDVRPRPACAGGRWDVDADEQASAVLVEQGSVYFRAAHLKSSPAARRGRQVALGRARNAFIEALTRDPFSAAAGRELDKLIAGLPLPTTKDGANLRCGFADRLRSDRLLDQAQVVYAQALWMGKTTSCVRSGLRTLRLDRASAHSLFSKGRALEADGRLQEARSFYITAVAWSPMLPGGRAALDKLDAPDPRLGTTLGHLGHSLDSVGNTVADVGGFATWLTDHANAFALGAAGLIVLLPILMWVLYAVTVKPEGRRLVSLLHLPRFARKQLIVTGFSPTDKAGTSEALFAHWLGQELANPEADANETVARSGDALTDLWEAPLMPESPFADAAALLGSSAQAGMVGAAIRLAQRVSPRREFRFSGQLLDRSEHGPGLRVIIASRHGRPQQDKIWWGVELPSAPTQEDSETDARHALAIVAATWAHDQVSD